MNNVFISPDGLREFAAFMDNVRYQFADREFTLVQQTNELTDAFKRDTRLTEITHATEDLIGIIVRFPEECEDHIIYLRNLADHVEELMNQDYG